MQAPVMCLLGSEGVCASFVLGIFTRLLRPEFKNVCSEDARRIEDLKLKALSQTCCAVVYGRSIDWKRHRERSIESIWGILCCPLSLKGSASQDARPGTLVPHCPYVHSLSICTT
jgi:hypothetical protein